MSINYIIIIVYGNIDMIAKYMPNLKKVSGFEDKSIFIIMGSGLVFCFLPLLIQTPFILKHYIAYDPALFINGKRSVAESHTEDRKYLCRFHPCKEILKRLYEIFETSKKQDLTPLLMTISSSQKMRCVLWNYVFGHFKRCGIE
jgi:hypothetical protein